MHVLQKKYGRWLRLHYPPPKSPWYRKAQSQLRSAINDLATFPGARAVHGHFAASEYADNSAKMITFVRDPVEQRISTYHYHRRRFENFGAVANDEARQALEMDLENFLKYHNPIYSRFIDVPVDRFAFIGRMESFDEDVRKLCEQLEMAFTPVNVNKNPKGHTYKVNAEWRRHYESAHPREMEIYENTLRRRKELLAG